jgi:hypothetical protein
MDELIKVVVAVGAVAGLIKTWLEIKKALKSG